MPGAICDHCFNAVKAEISKVPGVDNVHIESYREWIIVEGSGFEIDPIRAAVTTAGHVAQLWDVTAERFAQGRLRSALCQLEHAINICAVCRHHGATTRTR
jgi:copper chaperone CopZ